MSVSSDIPQVNLDSINYAFQAVNQYDEGRLSKDDPFPLAIAIIKKFGTKELSFVQKRLHLSSTQFEQLKDLAKSDSSIPQNIVTYEPIDISSEKTPDLIKKVHAKFPEAKFYNFANRVGNCKSVPIAEIGKEKYVIREKSADYIETYKEKQVIQHRPDFLVVGSKDAPEAMLSKFEGADVIDYRNTEHLDALASLIVDFSKSSDKIDFNHGNLVYKDGQITYIDQDLSYGEAENYYIDNFKDAVFEFVQQGFPLEESKEKLEYFKLACELELADANGAETLDLYDDIFDLVIQTALQDHTS